MNYTRGRNFFRALFIVSVLGLIVYGVFFLPEGFWGPEPPIEPTMVKFGFCPAFLFLGAVLLPILSAVGWVATTLLKNQQERERIDLEEPDEFREKGESMELIIDSVSKQYGTGVWGLRDFSLSLQPGILGLVGPNGAGKSTLMRILATITKPTSGTIIFNGIDLLQDPNQIREVLGYVPQDFGIYPNLDAVEFLEYLAAVKGLDKRSASQRIDELLQVVNLGEVRRHHLGGYSGGMKQRIGIAQALLNDPRLLIVDEPTAGLDPEERIRFRNLLSDLSGDRIVILSTHIVSDVEASATRIAVIRKGRLLIDAMPEELLQEVEGKVWEWTARSEDLPSIKQRYAISGTVRHRDGVEVRVISASSPDGNARLAPPRLEDAYLHLIAENGKGRTP